ncbi:MOSC N-terminal beta barrel domain-containing protein [Micromonospora sp. NPDC048999]|uniref:MOSC domain-containing protein n=1 Tax=Micromonospora sp. NPDC048999 TaxID=3155391 RepID=UPI0033C3697C
MRLAAVHLYPVKSCGGIEVGQATVEPWGLRHDRRWLVLNPDGGCLTARDEHRLLGVTAAPTPGSITLTGLDGATLTVPEPTDGQPVAAPLSRLDTLRLADDEAHEWLSTQLQRPLRLAWLDDPRRRPVATEHGGRSGDPLNLSDTGPLHATTLPSLRRLDEWMSEGAAERGEQAPQPLPMARFRPNVVIDGPFEPFAEDRWATLRIGEVRFRFADRCGRCQLTLIDPDTFTSGKEPIRTLARHRKEHGQTWFGVQLVPLTTGDFRVGDEVSVES